MTNEPSSTFNYGWDIVTINGNPYRRIWKECMRTGSDDPDRVYEYKGRNLVDLGVYYEDDHGELK